MGKVLITTDSCGMPPTAPVPVSPASGSAVGNFPTLCVSNSHHGDCPDPVLYRFQVSENPNFSTITTQSGWISEGSSSTCYSVSPSLANGRRFYWRCQASNGSVSSGWSSVYNFTTPNTPPPAPIAGFPSNQATVDSLHPTLIINSVADANGTPVVYYFQVSKFPDFSYLAAYSGAISGGGGLISWRIGSSLENGTTYYWRARAHDGIAYGNWMTTFSFTVDAPELENYLRGDINANGVAHEVADAVMYSNYFINGLSAFGNHVDASIASSDVNADSLTLSLADLVYLVRVLAGDALPYPRVLLSDYEAMINILIEQSTMTISTESSVEIGAGYIVLEHPGFSIHSPKLSKSARHMSFKHGDCDETLKLLIFSFEKNRVIPSGNAEVVSIPISGDGSVNIRHVELVDYYGHPIEVIENKISAIPGIFILHQNHPNPFNSETTIAYKLPSEQSVRLEVFNIVGQRVATLVDELQPAGSYEVPWDGTDDHGQGTASGIFIYRLVTDNFSDEKKMILLK
jgi:hypothetical protein